MYDLVLRASVITIIIVQAIMNLDLLLAWSCMCLIDCDLLEKVVNITNVYTRT